MSQHDDCVYCLLAYRRTAVPGTMYCMDTWIQCLATGNDRTMLYSCRAVLKTILAVLLIYIYIYTYQYNTSITRYRESHKK